MHLHYIEDESGDIVDIEAFCSDFCHREKTGKNYAGWNGCHESQFDTVCSNCGEKIVGHDNA